MSRAPDKVADPSLSLLQRIVEDAMDPGYREASLQRSGGETRARLGWRSSIAVAVVLFALGLLLVAAFLQVRDGAPSSSSARAQLAERIESASSELDVRSQEVDAIAAEVQALREGALAGTASDQQLAAQLSALEAQVGGSAVTGPGLTVTLTDGRPSPAGEAGPDLARVLDTDVQLVVNGLFASGADAVAVNGQRVTALSPIRSAGEAILVGFRPLTPPYLVSAVGPPSLPPTFNDSLARRELAGLSAAYGIGVDVDTTELTLPARPDLQLRYASEVRSQDDIPRNEEGSP